MSRNVTDRHRALLLRSELGAAGHKLLEAAGAMRNVGPRAYADELHRAGMNARAAWRELAPEPADPASEDAIGRNAQKLDRLYSDGVAAWNRALYETHPLGDTGRVLAQAAFVVLVSPVLAAGIARRVARACRRTG